MTETPPSPVDPLAALLRRVTAEEPAVTARELADGLWLARHCRPAVVDDVTPDPPDPPDDVDRTKSQVGRTPAGVDPGRPKPDPPHRDREPHGELFVRGPAGGSTGGGSTGGGPTGGGPTGRAARAPGATALPAADRVIAAMRPLMRRTPSRTRRVLDVDRTVYRMAEEGVREVVLRPAADRWLDLAIVVDTRGSMPLWRETVQELTGRLSRMGAFRSVRAWGWSSTDDRPDPTLTARPFEPDAGQPARQPQELLAPDGRQLILLVSDCVSAGWRNGRAVRLVRLWKDRAHVVLVDPLPERLWSRTGLGAATLISLRATVPAPSNAKLDWAPVRATPASTRQLQADARRPGLVLPVVTLEPGPLGVWAGLVAGRRRTTPGELASAHGFYWPAGPAEPPPPGRPAASDATAIVRRFVSTASPAAQKLASLLAAGRAVSVPVIRLIRQTMVPDAGQVDEAEVLLGGLLRPATDAARPTDGDPVEHRTLDFRPGVREKLLDALPATETLAVFARVSQYVADHFGDPNDFAAVLRDPGAHAGTVPASGVPFARTTAHILRRLGGAYAGLIHRPADGRTVRILHLGNMPPHSVMQPSLVLAGLIDAVRRLAADGLKPDLVVCSFNDTSGTSVITTDMTSVQMRDWLMLELLPAAGLSQTDLFLLPVETRVESAEASPTALGALRSAAQHRGQRSSANPSLLADAAAWVHERARPAHAHVEVRDLDVGVARGGADGPPLVDTLAALGPADLTIAIAPDEDDDAFARHRLLHWPRAANCGVVLCGPAARSPVTRAAADGWKTLVLPAGDLSPVTGPASFSLVEIDADARHVRVHRRFWQGAAWTADAPPRAWSMPSYWMDKASLPTAAEFERLPFWAVVAVVGQCGLRLADRYADHFPLESWDYLIGMGAASRIALDAAETRPSAESVIDRLNRQVQWESLLVGLNGEWTSCPKAAVAVIEFARAAFGSSLDVKEGSPDRPFAWPVVRTQESHFDRSQMATAAAAAVDAMAAITLADPRDTVFKEFRGFYDHVADAAVRENWTDDSPVKVDRPAPRQHETAEPTRRVLVAGTGWFDLPPAVLDAAGRVGVALARAGYGLITCGWPGVDHVTARAFVQTLGGANDQPFLTHVLGGGREADLKRGRATHVPSPDDESAVSIALADAVILIGGQGGTRHFGTLAWQADKPVLPLAATGTDAEAFARQMANDPSPLTPDDLARLGRPVPDAVAAVTDILGRLFSTPSEPPPPSETPASPTPPAAVQPDRSRPPTPEAFADLSRWDCLAIAARCLQRVLPLTAKLSPESRAMVPSLEAFVATVARSAESGSVPGNFVADVSRQATGLLAGLDRYQESMAQLPDHSVAVGDLVGVVGSMLRAVAGEYDCTSAAAEAASVTVSIASTLADPVVADVSPAHVPNGPADTPKRSPAKRKRKNK